MVDLVKLAMAVFSDLTLYQQNKVDILPQKCEVGGDAPLEDSEAFLRCENLKSVSSADQAKVAAVSSQKSASVSLESSLENPDFVSKGVRTITEPNANSRLPDAVYMYTETPYMEPSSVKSLKLFYERCLRFGQKLPELWLHPSDTCGILTAKGDKVYNGYTISKQKILEAFGDSTSLRNLELVFDENDEIVSPKNAQEPSLKEDSSFLNPKLRVRKVNTFDCSGGITHTWNEAQGMIKFAYQRSVTDVAIVAPPLHLLRAFVTSVSALLRQWEIDSSEKGTLIVKVDSDELDVVVADRINIASKTSGRYFLRLFAWHGGVEDWFGTTIHSQGITAGTRMDIMDGELERLETYKKAGQLYDPSIILAYLKERNLQLQL